MYVFKRSPDFKSICTFARNCSLARRTHYEVLNLRKNCSDKDIKDAFIQLSKEYHPDKNKSSQAQEQFVKIVEAYNVLSKPGSRARVRHNAQNNFYYETTNKSNNQYKSDSYYGFKGIKKLPNFAIILMCFGVAIVGLFLQILVISNSYQVHRKKLNEKSIRLAEELEKVRASAKGKTNEMQTQHIIDKIVAAANPSVATASLGQALANEKKGAENDYESLMNETQDISYNLPIENVKVTLYELIKNIISYLCYLFKFKNLSLKFD